MKLIATSWKLAVAALIAAALLTLTLNGISQPIEAKTTSYTADFTDVSGLRQGADVRVHGVLVGKVESIALQRKSGQSLGVVDFTLDNGFSVNGNSRLAIKYQALTGLRYIDVTNPSVEPSKASKTRHIDISNTQPSFDITTLFNGLQPVFATLSPDDLNMFAENAVTVLNGDGRGLAPLLDSMHKLTRFVADRQSAIAQLMRNLATVADTIGGQSAKFIQVLEYADRPLSAALSVLDEFRKSELYGPEFTGSAVRLLNNMGLKKGIDIDAAMDRAFTNLNDAIEAFKRVPVIWENIAPTTTGQEADLACSKGRGALPFGMDVLLNGQKVILCNQE